MGVQKQSSWVSLNFKKKGFVFVNEKYNKSSLISWYLIKAGEASLSAHPSIVLLIPEQTRAESWIPPPQKKKKSVNHLISDITHCLLQATKQTYSTLKIELESITRPVL